MKSKREIQQSPRDEAFEHAFRAWCRYYDECEAYDRSVCTGPVCRDGIMPMTARERSLVGQHALKKRDEVARAIHATKYVLGIVITEETSRRAKDAAQDHVARKWREKTADAARGKIPDR